MKQEWITPVLSYHGTIGEITKGAEKAPSNNADAFGFGAGPIKAAS